MYYTYLLYSESSDSYYCGQTNNVLKRLERHNSGETPSIRAGIPWQLVGCLEYRTRREAMMMEKRIKKRGIERWLNVYARELIKAQ